MVSAEAGLFQGHGLTFDSDIALPLQPATVLLDAMLSPDVTIRLGEVPEPDTAAESVGVLCAATPSTCWIDVPEVARYEISNGTNVIVAPATNGDPAAVSAFLVSSAVGALFHQRHWLTLGASVVAKDGRAFAIMSHAGEGQSTLAATLTWRGLDFLGDDLAHVVALSENPSGAAPMVHPGTTSVRLWPDALTRSDRNPNDYRRVCATISKREVPLAQSRRANPEALPLVGILIVGASSTDSVASRELSGRERFAALSSHTWRRRLVGACHYRNEHFADLAALATSTKVSSIIRPRNGDHFGETAALAESIIEGWGQDERE